MAIDISIIVPIYNVEEYLQECLESILKQKLLHIELLLIDDCSTDQSYFIAKKYAEKYDFVKLFKQPENRKVGAARNLGIDLAQGKYILFIDSDDFIATHSIHHLFNLAEKHQTDILLTTYWKKTEDRLSKISFDFPEKVLTGHNYMSQVKFLDILVCNKLWKTDFIKKNQFKFIEEGFEDVIFVGEAIQRAQQVLGRDLPYYYYRIRKGSTMTKSVSVGTFKSQFNLLFKLEEMYLKNINQVSKDQFYKMFLYGFVSFDDFSKRFQPSSEEEKDLKKTLNKKVYKLYSSYRKEIFNCKKLGITQKIALFISPALLRWLFKMKHPD